MELTMIELDRVTFSYGTQAVLEDITCSLPQGGFTGLLGPNGAGKTTLLRLACGTLIPAAGSVHLRGKDLRDLPRPEVAREIAVVGQQSFPGFGYTVKEIITMGRTPYLPPSGWLSTRDHQLVERAMEETEVTDLADRLLTEVSGGERQRVLIAMALAQEPALLLLDEPTSHLDVHHQFEVLELLRRLNREKGTTILATFHDMNLAASYCSRTILLDSGRLSAQGTPAEVLTADRLASVYKARAWVGKDPYLGRPLFLFAPGDRGERNRTTPGRPSPDGPLRQEQ